jgi:hypothetical protein
MVHHHLSPSPTKFVGKLYFKTSGLLLQTMVSNARVLGVGPRFMSVYVPKLSV